jgi:hypothetical protein
MNIREIKRHSLDFEKTISYFINHIKSGNTLSKKAIERVDLHQGSFFTLLPSTAELARLYEFAYGGIIPPIPYGDEIYEINNKLFHPMQVMTMGGELSKFILNYLQQNPLHYAVVDNVIIDARVASEKNDSIEMIPYNQEAYFFLNNESNYNQVYEIIRMSSQPWHFLTILTMLENLDSYLLENKTFSDICDNAKFIIVGAYDEEGYVFWEKNNALHKMT